MLGKESLKVLFGLFFMAVSVGSIVGLGVTYIWVMTGHDFEWGIYRFSFLIVELGLLHLMLFYVGYVLVDSFIDYDV